MQQPVHTLFGLYAVTDSHLCQGRLVSAVSAAIEGGATVVQYRDKSGDSQRRLQEATALRQLCAARGVLLLINDDIELARQVAADGVHLGQEDSALTLARQRLGERAIIGISCYNRLELAQQAIASGADYVAFGRFFNSSIKPRAVEAPIELLRQARRRFSTPIVAIGGITADNAPQLREAGADAVAVISDLFAYHDVKARAVRFRPLFS
ncbi:thiamine phosphate synthase [Ectothiorhodospiraceae bacterium BW-2]|nr:thiamine phosphate synthase [Ectothiorhodospiraceae bacterium BW-2]